MINYIKEKSASTSEQIEVVRKQLEKFSNLVDSLSKTLGNTEVIGDLVENELMDMDKAIEDAASKIQVSLLLYLIKLLKKYFLLNT
jgi:huntingtin interacting protein 1